MGAQDGLLLDPALRDWVLIPIFMVMLLVGILRHYVTLLMQSPPKKKDGLRAIREQRILLRSNVFRQNGHHLPPTLFNSHKSYLQSVFTFQFPPPSPSDSSSQQLQTQSSDSIILSSYLQNPPTLDADGKPQPNATPAAPPNPLTDPGAMDGMMGGLKNQMVMMVPQQILMGWINFFFSGFILIKLPFPLTLRFKSMLQRGIDTPDMDVTWVSSLSWYFLNLLGLNSVYRLILGEGNAADQTQDLGAMGGLGASILGGGGQPGAAMGPMGPTAPDYVKLYTAENENIEITGHGYRWVCDGVEDRVLKMFGES